jgi:hypothetical protein
VAIEGGILKTHAQLHSSERNMFLQFYRNGRWGTCVDCPRDTNGQPYPEFCKETDRHDHRLTLEELVHAYTVRLK